VIRGRITGPRRIVRTDGYPLANREAWQRRSELYDLAFLLLGGSRAARGFLGNDHAGLSQAPVVIAMKSSLGLVEVTRALRREAFGLR